MCFSVEGILVCKTIELTRHEYVSGLNIATLCAPILFSRSRQPCSGSVDTVYINIPDIIPWNLAEYKEPGAIHRTVCSVSPPPRGSPNARSRSATPPEHRPSVRHNKHTANHRSRSPPPSRDRGIGRHSNTHPQRRSRSRDHSLSPRYRRRSRSPVRKSSPERSYRSSYR